MIRDRATFLNPIEAGRQIADIIAARPATTWSDALHLVPEEQTRHLVARVNAWTTTPTETADPARDQTRSMRRRLNQPPAERWQRWADTTGLAGTPEWPQIAARLDDLHHAGADTNLLARRLASVPAAVMTATLAQHKPGGHVEIDWRPWAEAVNPALCTAETWASTQANLTRLQATGTDLTALAQALTGRDPEKVAAALRNALRNHSAQTAQETSRYPEMARLQVRRRVDREGSRSV